MVMTVHECPECAKTFPSDKALHGHMRLHPKRSYRGVNPHGNAAKSKAAPKECSTSSSNSSKGSDSNAGKLSKTSKPLDNSTYKQTLNFRTDLEAFYKDWDTEEYYEGDGSQYKARYIRTLNLEECDPRFIRFCKRLISEALEKEEEEKEEEGDIKTTISPTVAMSNGMNNAATKTNTLKKRKVCTDNERNTRNGGQYICVTCKKTFNSHQALGGHQTLHRQKTQASLPSTTKEASEAKTHICKICEREFSSGHALGGHQRLHYQGPIHNKARKGEEIEKSRSRSSSASTHSSAANGDDYEYDEGEIPPSPNNSAAAQLELEMQVEMEDEGSKGYNLLAALQSKLEMEVKMEDEVGSKGCGFDLNIESIHKEAEVVEDGEKKGAMVTNQTHVDPRTNHAHKDRNINLPSPQPQPLGP